jgi:hypothetical protein
MRTPETPETTLETHSGATPENPSLLEREKRGIFGVRRALTEYRISGALGRGTGATQVPRPMFFHISHFSVGNHRTLKKGEWSSSESLMKPRTRILEPQEIQQQPPVVLDFREPYTIPDDPKPAIRPSPYELQRLERTFKAGGLIDDYAIPGLPARAHLIDQGKI